MTQATDPRRGRYLALHMTAEHPCSYLDDRRARTLFVDPTAHIDSATYQALVDQGFRRSGAHIYRPACRGCADCIPVRLPVEAFIPDRSQRRNWSANAPVVALTDTPARFDPAHFALYQTYLAERHPQGCMTEESSVDSYRQFLVEPWGGATRFIEFRPAGQLIGVAVTDVLEHGLSAVYTFFDPGEARRALGTFAILAQIEAARRLALPYLYLGYWIGDCRKMRYKERFRPIEAWDGHAWRRFTRRQPIDLG